MTSQTHRPLTLAALLCAVFMAAMEATVVATAMPSVVSDLGGIELYGWVGAVYLLASTVTMPLFGKLADQRGRKPVLLWGIALFLAGSMASGAAGSMLQLIAARGLQGLGAGAIQPISMTVVGDLYRPERRAKIQAAFGAVWALAGVSGPLLGGFLVSSLSWRWVFYVNVPFGMAAAVLLSGFFSEHRQSQSHRFDLWGVLTSSLAVVCLLLGVGGTAPALSLSASAVATGLFIWREKKAPEPLLPLSLMTTRLMLTSNITFLFLGGVMTGLLLYVPLFVQSVLGSSPTIAGTAVAPMMLGWPLASSSSGRLLVRYGYRRLVRSGGLLVALACTLLLLPLNELSGPWVLRSSAFVLGSGLGLANTSLLIAVQESVQWGQRGVATAMALFFRSVGGALSAGALGAQLAAALSERVNAETLAEVLQPQAAGRLSLHADALRMGMHDVFLSIVAMGACAWLCTWTFPRHVESAQQPAT